MNLAQRRRTFGQVEPTPDNPEKPNGDEEEAGNEDPAFVSQQYNP